MIIYYDFFKSDFLNLVFYVNDQNELVAIEYHNFPLRKDNPFKKIKSSSKQVPKKLTEIKKQFAEYLTMKRKEFTINIQLSGTPFQLKVWKFLLSLSFGEVVSYGEIAQKIGHPNSQRAVGNAVGANPLNILIPCHRVLNQGKNRVGHYNGSENVKKKLLQLEGVNF